MLWLIVIINDKSNTTFEINVYNGNRDIEKYMPSIWVRNVITTHRPIFKSL